MPDIHTTECDDDNTCVWDGPDRMYGGNDHVGSIIPGSDGNGWIVAVWRRLRSREDALKVLALVAELSGKAE